MPLWALRQIRLVRILHPPILALAPASALMLPLAPMLILRPLILAPALAQLPAGLLVLALVPVLVLSPLLVLIPRPLILALAVAP